MGKCTNLIALDQRPLRLQAANELETWHNKIESLEIEIQKFHETDFKLYSDWLRLTLNDLQEENNLLLDKYKKLALFHNWVVFTTEDKNISLPHAFFLIAEEELKFQKGSKDEKEQIEKLRQERSKKINAEFKSEKKGDFVDEDQLESDLEPDNAERSDDSFDTEGCAAEEEEELHIRSMRKKFQKEILFFENLADKKIVKKMRLFDEGINLISDCVYICSQCYRFDIVERIWNFVPLKIKTRFNADFKKQTGVTLDQYLINVKNHAQKNSSLGDDDNEFNFKAHFESPFSTSGNEVLPESIVAAKIVYRRIMMKIHPDKLSTEFVTSKKNWLDRLWKKIQTAYNKTDIKALQNLHLQVLVTLRKYDDLDYSELKAGSALLQNELTRLGQSQQATLQHPAWGFSKLKSYKKLEKLVAEPYKKTAKDLTKEIKRIEATHVALKDFVDSVQATGGFGRSRPRRPAKRRKKQHNIDKRQHD